VHPRDCVDCATYECKNTRVYAGVDEKCASEKLICVFIDAIEIADNTQQSDLVADESF
jgi:hypothetical protein